MLRSVVPSERGWRAVLPPGVPEEFNLASFLLDRHLAEGRANKPAVYYEHETITYAELAEAANRVGGRRRLGIAARG
jgi:acyl-coenzyme A synthetase/AMP-(fatty) acid ligase